MFLGIKNPHYINADGEAIDLIIETDNMGDLPFTYDPQDNSPASVWVRKNLDFTQVAPYSPPVITVEEAIKNKCAELFNYHNLLIKAGLETSGVVVNDNGDSVQFKAKIDDQSVSMWQMSKQSIADKGLTTFPVVRDWYDVEYEDVPAGEVIKIADDVVEYRTNLWVKLAKLQKLAKSQITIEGVEAVTWE